LLLLLFFFRQIILLADNGTIADSAASERWACNKKRGNFWSFLLRPRYDRSL